MSTKIKLIIITMVTSFFITSNSANADNNKKYEYSKNNHSFNAQLGPRPFFIIDSMDESTLKTELKECSKNTFKKTNFSIGHRGAAMQFPEHTKESYEAAARMGAGIVECDVTFTKDRELVCRHSQCDLHTTTNILATPLAQQCSIPPDYNSETPFANVKCCTNDITVAQFKTLKGKMDAGNPKAKTLNEYLNSTPSWRTDRYSGKATLMTHAESINLFKSLNVKMTPELKSPSIAMPYQGDFTQEKYAQKMINEYKLAGINPKNVFAQSFNVNDVKYWIDNEPEFGKQAVYLDGRYDDPSFDHTNSGTWSPSMEELSAKGINIIAPPMWMLVTLDENNNIVPSTYAHAAKEAGLDIITWTLERAGLLKDGGGWYYQTTNNVINNDGDAYEMLDVLAQDVGILGIFSDWPATVSYYANCKGLK